MECKYLFFFTFFQHRKHEQKRSLRSLSLSVVPTRLYKDRPFQRRKRRQEKENKLARADRIGEKKKKEVWVE